MHTVHFKIFPTTNHTNQNALCFYHSLYGAKAKKCTPPCNFKIHTDNIAPFTQLKKNKNSTNVAVKQTAKTELNNPSDFCYFHQHHGIHANKYRAPCNFKWNPINPTPMDTPGLSMDQQCDLIFQYIRLAYVVPPFITPLPEEPPARFIKNIPQQVDQPIDHPIYNWNKEKRHQESVLATTVSMISPRQLPKLKENFDSIYGCLCILDSSCPKCRWRHY